MRLLLDQGLARATAMHLAAHGHEVVHVGELGMATALDAEILKAAERERQVVVTLDADFHALLAQQEATRPSVVRLRVQGFDAAQVAALIQRVIESCGGDLEIGAVVTANAEHIRVRRLPIR